MSNPTLDLLLRCRAMISAMSTIFNDSNFTDRHGYGPLLSALHLDLQNHLTSGDEGLTKCKSTAMAKSITEECTYHVNRTTPFDPPRWQVSDWFVHGSTAFSYTNGEETKHE